MKKIISLLLCLVMIFAVSLPINAASNFKSAKNYTLGSTESARIINAAGDNIYKFTLTSPAKIGIDLYSKAHKLNLKIHDKSEKELWSERVTSNSSADQMSYSNLLYLNPGDYYFSVISAGQEGNFSFVINQEPTYETAVETQNGSNNTLKEASAIYVGGTVTGFIAANDSADYYKFSIPSEGKLTFGISGKFERMLTKIFDETGKELWSDSPSGVTDEGFSVVNNLYLNKGNYFLLVEKAKGEGQYSFTLNHTPANESFTEAQCGNNNKTDAACTIVKNQKYIGFFSLNDDTDTYRIAINEPSLSFTIVSEAHELQVSLFNQNGRELGNHHITAEKYSGKVNYTKNITVPEGVCFMSVKRISGYGSFTFSLTDSGYAKEPLAPQSFICVSVGGKLVPFDQPPVLENGRTLVPLRAIFEALGASVEWDAMTQTVKSVKDNTQISLQIGSSSMYVNGTAKTLDVPAKIINSRTLVPVRAVSEAYGASVEWDQYSQTVIIK